ncbi:MAG: hypothetical protein QG670_502 [Thermoproteota archaeon]|nr:hypothetical protein [Thermoproteota archaeon]
MSYTSDFDEVFNDLSKIIRKLMSKSALEKAIDDGNIKGKWNMQTIDEPDVKGFSIRGQFYPEQPLDPHPNPFEPAPLRRPPTPERPFFPTEDLERTAYEPLVDVFDGESDVRLYIELPNGGKEGIQLSVVEGGVEIKAKDFYKIVKVPFDVDIERASSRHKNRVLEVTIPKKREIQQSSPQKIRIE